MGNLWCVSVCNLPINLKPLSWNPELLWRYVSPHTSHFYSPFLPTFLPSLSLSRLSLFGLSEERLRVRSITTTTSTASQRRGERKGDFWSSVWVTTRFLVTSFLLVTQLLQTTNSRNSPDGYKQLPLCYYWGLITILWVRSRENSLEFIMVIVVYTDVCLINYNLNLPHIDRWPLWV